MTDEMMSLQALLEKSADADLLREMTGFAAHRLRLRRARGPDLTANAHDIVQMHFAKLPAVAA